MPAAAAARLAAGIPLALESSKPSAETPPREPWEMRFGRVLRVVGRRRLALPPAVAGIKRCPRHSRRFRVRFLTCAAWSFLRDRLTPAPCDGEEHLSVLLSQNPLVTAWQNSGGGSLLGEKRVDHAGDVVLLDGAELLLDLRHRAGLGFRLANPEQLFNRWEWLLTTDGLRFDPWERNHFPEDSPCWQGMRRKWNREQAREARN